MRRTSSLGSRKFRNFIVLTDLGIKKKKWISKLDSIYRKTKSWKIFFLFAFVRSWILCLNFPTLELIFSFYEIAWEDCIMAIIFFVLRYKINNYIRHISSSKMITLGLEYSDCVRFREVRPPPPEKSCPRYGTKLNLMVRIQIWISRECRVLLYSPYSQVHSDQEGKYLSRYNQIDLVKNYSYLNGSSGRD